MKNSGYLTVNNFVESNERKVIRLGNNLELPIERTGTIKLEKRFRIARN